MLCWNPSKCTGTLGAWATCHLAWSCNTPFSTPNSNVSIFLTSLWVDHMNLHLVTYLGVSLTLNKVEWFAFHLLFAIMSSYQTCPYSLLLILFAWHSISHINIWPKETAHKWLSNCLSHSKTLEMNGSLKSKLPYQFSNTDNPGLSSTSAMVGMTFSLADSISKWDSDFLMTSCLEDCLPLIYTSPDASTKFSL